MCLYFITGAPRSGTTLLFSSLNKLPSIFIPKETHFFLRLWSRIIPRNPNSIRRALTLAVANDNHFAVPNSWIEQRNELSDVGCYEALIDLILRQKNANIVIEKTPSHFHYMERISRERQVKLVHINYAVAGIGIYGRAVSNAMKTVRTEGVIRIVDCRRIENEGVSTIRFALLFLKQMGAVRPDVVLDTSGKSAFLSFCMVFLAAKIFRSKLVVVDHDPVDHSGMERSHSRIFVSNAMLRDVDRIVVHGDYRAEQLERHVGVSVHEIPHVNLAIFKRARTAKKGIEREQLVHPTPNSIKILFFGALRPNKGVAILPDYARALRRERMAADLTVAGSQKLSATLMASSWPTQLGAILEELRTCGVNVVDGLLGDAEVDNLMSGHDIVLLPYKDATQSGVLALAASYGKLVVCTDVGDVGVTVREYKLGAACEYCVDSLARGTKWVKENESELRNNISTYAGTVIDDQSIGSAFLELLCY